MNNWMNLFRFTELHGRECEFSHHTKQDTSFLAGGRLHEQDGRRLIHILVLGLFGGQFESPYAPLWSDLTWASHGRPLMLGPTDRAGKPGDFVFMEKHRIPRYRLQAPGSAPQTRITV